MGWRRRKEKQSKLAIKVLVRRDKAVDKGNNPLGSFLPFLIECELVVNVNHTFLLNCFPTESRGKFTDQEPSCSVVLELLSFSPLSFSSPSFQHDCAH